MHENEIARIVVGAAYKLHKQLGPGLLESVYERLLQAELEHQRLAVQRQVALPLVYEGLKLEAGFRIDLLVENKLIVEVKSVEGIADVHEMQLLTYLKLSGKRLGLLINFNVPLIKNGISWIVNGLKDQS